MSDQYLQNYTFCPKIMIFDHQEKVRVSYTLHITHEMPGWKGVSK